MGKKLEPLLVSRQEVCEFLGCGLVTLWRLNNDPDFPKPIKITKRKVGYSLEQLKKWVEKQTEGQKKEMESAKTYNKDDVLTNAIGVFGTTSQIIVSIEELSELQKELTKTLRGKFNREHVVEELADVEIMLEQLKIIFNIKDLELNETKYNKIKRLKEIISERIEGKTSEVMQKVYGGITKGPVSEPAND